MEENCLMVGYNKSFPRGFRNLAPRLDLTFGTCKIHRVYHNENWKKNHSSDPHEKLKKIIKGGYLRTYSYKVVW